MTKRTFSRTLPAPGKDTSWPQNAHVNKGKIARSGASLPTMPFIRPNNGPEDKPIEFEWTSLGRDEKSHDFFYRFAPGPNLHLPGPTADRVMRALLSMSPSEAGKVKASLKEMTQLCRLIRGGKAYNRIERAVRRLHGVKVESNAFWDYQDQRYVDGTCEIFSDYKLSKKGNMKMMEVTWAPSFIDRMSGWSKPLILEHLFDLDSCLARKLYQISSLGIYQQGEMVEDLKLLCHGQLGISKSQKCSSEMKDSLDPPAAALRSANLIDLQVSKDDVVRARPMNRMLDLQEEIDDPQYWAFQLFGRGMMDFKDDSLEKCRKWVDRKGVSRARSATRKWDRPGGGGNPIEDATPIEEATSTDCPRCTSEPRKEKPSQGKFSQGKPSQGTSSKGREQAVEEKISIYLQLIDSEKHGRLHRRARRCVDEKYPGLGGDRRRVLAHEAVGKIFLEREGTGSLPDPLSDQLE